MLKLASVDRFPFLGPFENDRCTCGGNQAFKIEIDAAFCTPRFISGNDEFFIASAYCS
jgi:hypothetical protein